MIIIKKFKKVNEDDVENGAENGDVSQEVSPQVEDKKTQLNAQIAELLNKKAQRKVVYQNDMKTIDAQMVQLQRQKAELGEDVDVNCIEETQRYRFYRKLYESVLNKTDEMFSAIYLSFEAAPDLSMRPNKTRCRTFAKNIISYLNKVSWDDGNDHSNEFFTYVSRVLDQSQLSLSNKEKDSFLDTFKDAIKEKSEFKWIFGIDYKTN